MSLSTADGHLHPHQGRRQDLPDGGLPSPTGGLGKKTMPFFKLLFDIFLPNDFLHFFPGGGG